MNSLVQKTSQHVTFVIKAVSKEILQILKQATRYKTNVGIVSVGLRIEKKSKKKVFNKMPAGEVSTADWNCSLTKQNLTALAKTHSHKAINVSVIENI